MISYLFTFIFQANLKRLIFIDDSKAVMSFYKDQKRLDMHTIDLRSMTEVPVQGKVFKDDVFMLKVNSGKGNIYFINVYLQREMTVQNRMAVIWQI